MKTIEDYITEKIQLLLNKKYVNEQIFLKNKKIIDSLYNEILKNIESGNSQFIIDLDETTDINIINIIRSQMNSHGWRCEYYSGCCSGDYKPKPYIKFTFIDLEKPDAQTVHDYYNK